jgi:hypothetical protein
MRLNRALFTGCVRATQRCIGQLPKPAQLRFHPPSFTISPVLRTFHSSETSFNNNYSLESRLKTFDGQVLSLEERVNALESPLVSLRENIRILDKLVESLGDHVKALERLILVEIALRTMTERKQRSPHRPTLFEKVMCVFLIVSYLGLIGVMICEVSQ